MSRKIRYRLPPTDPLPTLGDYLMSERGRGGYLILGIVNAGVYPSLAAEPEYRLLRLTVERVSRAECEANGERLWTIKWDRRERRRRATV